MLDVVVFSEGLAGGGARAGTVALQNVAGLGDSHVTVVGDNITVPAQCSKVLAVYCSSNATAASLTNAHQLSSPSLRASSLIDLPNWEINGAAAAAATLFPGNIAGPLGALDLVGVTPINDFKESPVDLQPGEAMQYLTSVDVAAVDELVRAVIILTDGTLAQPFLGRIETVVADGVAAAVAGVWTPTAIVFRQVLRAGTYAVVGMKFVSTTGVVARLVFGNQGPRPGVICTPAHGGGASGAVEPLAGMFRYGRLGVWGTFTHTNPPVPEIICAAADAGAVQHYYLDVVKIA
jgi:hypothetical protein